MINSITIAGRISNDVETKNFDSGQKVAMFSVAVQRNFKNNGEYVSDFFNCRAWGATADFVAKYFSKGQYIALTGELMSNKYVDSEGNNRYNVYINATNVMFFHKKDNGAEKLSQEQAQQPISMEGLPDLSDDGDLPF